MINETAQIDNMYRGCWSATLVLFPSSHKLNYGACELRQDAMPSNFGRDKLQLAGRERVDPDLGVAEPERAIVLGPG